VFIDPALERQSPATLMVDLAARLYGHSAHDIATFGSRLVFIVMMMLDNAFA